MSFDIGDDRCLWGGGGGGEGQGEEEGGREGDGGKKTISDCLPVGERQTPPGEAAFSV